MKVFVLYHPKSEHGGAVEDYAKEYKRFKKKGISLISLETIEGAHYAKLYDVLIYPALLIIRDDGQLVKIWQNGSLPPQAELDSYIKA